MAASSYTVSWQGLWGGPEVGETIEITYAVTCESTVGSMTAITTDADSIADGRTYTELIRGRRFVTIEANPGTPAPDAASVTVKDSDGYDLLNGNGTNLIHATNTLIDYVEVQDAIPADMTVRGNLTIALADQATISAQFTLILTFV